MTLNEAIQHCKEQVQEQAKKGCYSCVEKHQQLAEWLKELKAYKDARAEIAEAFNDNVRNDQNDYERGRKSGIFLCESIISVKLGESRSEIPNTCSDAISRKSAIDLANELKDDLPDDDRLSDMVMSHNEGILDYQTKLSLLPSVSPQTCDDVVSREAVLALSDFVGKRPTYSDPYGSMEEVVRVKDIENLPSVAPQQKMGRWITSHIPESVLCECSACGFTCGAYSFNYCPNCGAKMECGDAT